MDFESKPSFEEQVVAWQEMSAVRPKLVVDVGGGAMGTMLVPLVRKEFESGGFVDSRYLNIDPTASQMVRDYWVSMRLGIEDVFGEKSPVSPASADQVWMRNIGSVVPKIGTDWFGNAMNLLKPGGELWVVDNYTPGLYQNRGEIVEALEKQFGEVLVEDLSDRWRDVSHPLVKSLGYPMASRMPIALKVTKGEQDK